jgi:hypothetical protein
VRPLGLVPCTVGTIVVAVWSVSVVWSVFVASLPTEESSTNAAAAWYYDWKMYTAERVPTLVDDCFW